MGALRGTGESGFQDDTPCPAMHGYLLSEVTLSGQMTRVAQGQSSGDEGPTRKSFRLLLGQPFFLSRMKMRLLFVCLFVFCPL